MSDTPITPLRIVLGEVRYVLFFAFLLFAPAQSFHWWRAWVLLFVLFVMRTSGAFSVYLVNRALLTERSKLPLHKGQPLADRLLLPAFMASFAALVAFCSFERFHLIWLAEPPRLLSVVGLLAFVVGWMIVFAALRANPFATTVVRHQTEREHRVKDDGIYAVVRHPMYGGLLPVIFGLGLWLGSYAAVLAALVPAAILMLRIVFEERTLRAGLPEYSEYAARVPSRLIPGVW